MDGETMDGNCMWISHNGVWHEYRRTGRTGRTVPLPAATQPPEDITPLSPNGIDDQVVRSNELKFTEFRD